MKRCLILAEGQTEERFVKDCLAPHLAKYSVIAVPTIVTTRRVGAGKNRKGGNQYRRVRDDLLRLLGDSDAVAVTTLIDYYGLPDDFPGMSDRPAGNPGQRVAHVEHALANDIDHPTFIPHLTLHEFEAWLYCDWDTCAWVFEEYGADALEPLRQVSRQFSSPEDINEDRATAPSRRILAALPGYQKTLHGPMAVEVIGLDQVRAQCPHFNAWLEKLEAL